MNPANISTFNLKDTDYVLDVGGGHVPFPRANVIVDNFPENEYNQPQRANTPMVIPEGAKLIKADATDMPFKDKEFDFVVCAETLNHVKDPIGACKEIIRVGKRGYIEIPSALTEVFISHPEHLWVALWNGSKLMFIKNNFPENTMAILDKGAVNPKSVNLHIQKEAWRIIQEKVSAKCREAIYIEFVWDGSFEYGLIENNTKFNWGFITEDFLLNGWRF